MAEWIFWGTLPSAGTALVEDAPGRVLRPPLGAIIGDVSPPPIKGFTHVSLSVGDLETSMAFYSELLGLEVLAEPYDGTAFDGREAMVLAGRTALCLQEHRHRTSEPFDPCRRGLDHISLAVASRPELDEFARHLDAEGVTHSGVKPLPGYGHFIELRDPDGILVELHALP